MKEVVQLRCVMQADQRMGPCHVGCYDSGHRIFCPCGDGHQPFLPSMRQACSNCKANVIAWLIVVLYSCVKQDCFCYSGVHCTALWLSADTYECMADVSGQVILLLAVWS